jgi:DNA invertase Pin-like site-specific DNA recombinase
MKFRHEFMAYLKEKAVVTDEERRLIDEAIAAGKAKKVTGSSVRPSEYQYEKGKLVVANPLHKRIPYTAPGGMTEGLRKKNAQTAEIAAATRAEVVNLRKQNMSYMQIAKMLGVSKTTAKKHWHIHLEEQEKKK